MQMALSPVSTTTSSWTPLRAATRAQTLTATASSPAWTSIISCRPSKPVAEYHTEESAVETKCFRTAREFRTWLDRHHADSGELLVCFHKVHTGTPCMTWPESV